MATCLKQDAQNMLANVPPEYVFKFRDGSILNNMSDRGDALLKISDEEYVYHVNSSKNDFSKWVRDIIKDERWPATWSKPRTGLRRLKELRKGLQLLEDDWPR